MEIFVLNSGDGYFALLQCAEGVASKRVLLPAVVHGPLLYPDGFKVYELEIPARVGRNNRRALRRVSAAAMFMHAQLSTRMASWWHVLIHRQSAATP
jgi:hypothetical protein